MLDAIIAQELLDCPLDRKVAKVGVVLTDTDEEHWHVCRMNQAHEGAHHVANSITLGNDEAVQGTGGAKGGIEVAGLGDGVGTDESLEGAEERCHVQSG